PASDTIQKLSTAAVIVTTPTTAPADYQIAFKRIYRAASGDAGTVYLFVDEIPLSQDMYVDDLSDAELGEELETADFDLPPADGMGFLASANGIRYIFVGNLLVPSAKNRPHAYPVRFRLPTDFPIVAIRAMDTD